MVPLFLRDRGSPAISVSHLRRAICGGIDRDPTQGGIVANAEERKAIVSVHGVGWGFGAVPLARIVGLLQLQRR